jgi:hypothetical protein
MVVDDANDKGPPPPLTPQFPQRQNCDTPTALRFPPLFSSGFGPAPLHEGFSITRPTIELPLDEILNAVDASDQVLDFWTSQYPEPARSNNHDSKKLFHDQPQLQDVHMDLPTMTPMNSYTPSAPPINRAAAVTPTSVSPLFLPQPRSHDQ